MFHCYLTFVLKKSAALTKQIYLKHDENLKLEAANRQDLLHKETVNIMSKYQVVYIKMETSLKNWMKWTDSKMRTQRLKNAFDIMKMKAQVYKQA